MPTPLAVALPRFSYMILIKWKEAYKVLFFGLVLCVSPTSTLKIVLLTPLIILHLNCFYKRFSLT